MAVSACWPRRGPGRWHPHAEAKQARARGQQADGRAQPSMNGSCSSQLGRQGRRWGGSRTSIQGIAAAGAGLAAKTALTLFMPSCIGQEGTCVGCCNRQPLPVTVGQAGTRLRGLQHAPDAARQSREQPQGVTAGACIRCAWCVVLQSRAQSRSCKSGLACTPPGGVS